ncbi:MAG: ABC-F family ATP-binding cassette domain-containing protein [Candidatus Riflebacteria bacterium]|nr:ABC-F family ATP-binding cassette domain-containing protein [Candidatus Riflebacteria bacterium]
MLLVNGSNVHFSYPGSPEEVFAGISFSIYSGAKIGVVGSNGSGKTTLLKLIQNNAENVIIGYLSQEIVFAENQSIKSYVLSDYSNLAQIYEKIFLLESKSELSETEGVILANLYTEYSEKEGFSIETEIYKKTSLMGLEYCDLNGKMQLLSGGEKTKVALLRLLIKNPDILILDEPTNHLDTDTLTWLEGFLGESNTAYLIVSHDRRFLDACCKEMWEIKDKKINIYTGNYSDYKKSKNETFLRALETSKQLEKHISKLENAVDKTRTEANRMENFKPKRSFGKNKKICKRDAGSGKGLLRTQNKQRAANAMSLRLGKMIEQSDKIKPFIEKKRSLSFAQNELRNNTVLKIEKISKKYDDNILFDKFSLIVSNRERLAITGPNGSGKSTLLKMLMGIERPDSGTYSWALQASIGYYSQELELLNPQETVLESVLKGRLPEESRARTILGCLRLEKDAVLKKTSEISSGEKSKTLLASLLFDSPDVLVLDEPTNHLEIEAREALEAALDNYDGTLIFVSHDRYFVEKLAENVLELD